MQLSNDFVQFVPFFTFVVFLWNLTSRIRSYTSICNKYAVLSTVSFGHPVRTARKPPKSSNRTGRGQTGADEDSQKSIDRRRANCCQRT